MNTTVKVHGMHCASCASIITKKISKLSGVEHIDVNPGTEKVELNFDSEKISIHEMNKTIEPLGYSFSEAGGTGEMKMMDMSEHHHDVSSTELESE